jgi:hypothetical protein
MIKIIRTKCLPAVIKALTTPWAIYARPKARLNEVDVNHESIHAKQWAELFYIVFIFWYVIEYFVHLLKHRKHSVAYRRISFEREAYSHQHEEDYLKTRKPYAFTKYLK